MLITTAQLLALQEAGKLPEGFARREVKLGYFELIDCPVGIPMGFQRCMCDMDNEFESVDNEFESVEGKRMVQLLDDFMFAFSGDLSFEEAEAVRDEVLAKFEAVGAQINWKGSALTASQCLRSLVCWSTLSSKDSLFRLTRSRS